MDYFEASLRTALRLILSADGEVLRIALTSLRISLFSVLVACFLALPAGILLGMADFPGRRLVRQFLGALMALPTVVVGLLLYGLLSRKGPLGELGLLYTPWAIIIGQSVLILPLLIHSISTSVMGADPRLSLTLDSLGANLWQRGWYLMKETRLGILAAVVNGFGRAIGEVGVAMMLGGNIAGYTRTMTTAIALETSKGEFELGLALGGVLLAVAFVLNYLLLWLQKEI